LRHTKDHDNLVANLVANYKHTITTSTTTTSTTAQDTLIFRTGGEHEPLLEMKVPTIWPSQGKIKFEGVVKPYLPNSPLVQKGISFSVHPGKKIGVVGCTSAGKSSLIVALYCSAKSNQGKIEVDSIDCSFVNLNKLRSSMAITPILSTSRC
jgi:ABC-type multidrug transport system fused ATPase/permease subunit